MSMTAGPHIPEKGWEIRWFIQAGALLLHSPLTIIIGICGILFSALVFMVISGLSLNQIILSLVPALGGIVPMMICASLGVSEGYGIARISDVIKGFLGFVITVFVVFNITIIVTLGIIMIAGDPISNLPDSSSRNQIDTFVFGGIISVCVAFYASIPMNIFWFGLVTQMPMPLMQLFMSNLKLVNRVFWPWFMLISGTLVMVQFAIILPAFVGMAILIFLSAWIYVAGREIFGGISSNQYPSRNTAMKQSIAH